MKKRAVEKLNTRIKRLLLDKNIKKVNNKIKIGNRVILEYDNRSVKYSFWRYYPTKVDSIVKESFKVTIYMTGKKFDILGSNIINPPNYASSIVRTFTKLTDFEINHIILGAESNTIRGKTLRLTKDLYDLLNSILKEESTDRNVRITNRIAPIIEKSFGIKSETMESCRNYTLLMKEILASGNYTQEDVLAFTEKLESGKKNTVVIEKQIKKQTQWLIDTLQDIVDQPYLTVEIARNLGNKHFGFSKNEISGPEELMEKILTEYGKNTFFGSPILINTNKYVVSKKAISKSQFDLILVNQLNDIEVVELKRPDKPVLSYDQSRNKFYASKDLSIAISQAERYLSAIIKDNDDDYLIDGKKIGEFMDELIGGTTKIDICRPSAIIIIGSHQTITEDYNKLNEKNKLKVSKEDYFVNGLMAYKELKTAFRNIQIMTYSELIENARLRLT